MAHYRTEIEELHGFFQAWLGGVPHEGEVRFERLERALAPGFTFVTPGGRALERSAVVEGVRSGRSSRPGLRIEVGDPRLLHDAGDLLVATYEEWQHEGERTTGRRSTVVFRRDEDGPNGLRWLHVHETWIEPPAG